jgi:hypothetical protein
MKYPRAFAAWMKAPTPLADTFVLKYLIEI